MQCFQEREEILTSNQAVIIIGIPASIGEGRGCTEEGPIADHMGISEGFPAEE